MSFLSLFFLIMLEKTNLDFLKLYQHGLTLLLPFLMTWLNMTKLIDPAVLYPTALQCYAHKKS